MPKVELIYDQDCPNIQAARVRLKEALEMIGWPTQWKEWVRQAPGVPDYVSRFGSPTILIEGKDVGGEDANFMADSCRVYPDEKGEIHRAPSLEMILSSLENTAGNKTPEKMAVKSKGHWKSLGGVFPVLGSIFIPGITCPACWPAYAGLLSSFGIGFFNYTPYLLPLTVLLVLIALFSLGFRAKNRHGFLPLVLGSFASLVFIAGRFVLNSDWILYGGVAGLIAASLWNSWPVKKTKNQTCPDCPTTGTAGKI